MWKPEIIEFNKVLGQEIYGPVFEFFSDDLGLKLTSG